MTLEQLIEMGLSEDVAKKVLEAHQAVIKDQFIPKARFDEVNEQKNQYKQMVEERDTQLNELKDKAKGNDELTTKIAELEQQNQQTKQEYEAKMAELRKHTAIELALKDQRARNVKAVKALLDLGKVSLDGENLIGLEDQLKGLRESDPYLFGEDKLAGREPHREPSPSADSQGRKNPFSKEHFNLTEQGRLYREDPELAKRLKELAK